MPIEQRSFYYNVSYGFSYNFSCFSTSVQCTLFIIYLSFFFTHTHTHYTSPGLIYTWNSHYKHTYGRILLKFTACFFAHALTTNIKFMQSNKICLIFCSSCNMRTRATVQHNRNPNNKKIQLVAIWNGACFSILLVSLVLFCHFIDRNRKSHLPTKCVHTTHLDGYSMGMHLQAEVSLCLVCLKDNFCFFVSN